ncbi:MAG: long-chain fatty acid--CoA ligase [Candidatus Eremiobacteraeota bacterium]|nr:long-chain fatty acid--CoA ligase [Candidatus Eremiobacteraeota bacterium]
MEIQTLQELVNLFRDRKSMCLEGNKEYSYKQAYHTIVTLARGFLSSGLAPGDRVMIMSQNRTEWMLTSLALNYAGIIDVPRGVNASDTEINYILKHSAPGMIIVDNEKAYMRMKGNREIISIEKIHGIRCLDDIIKKGEKSHISIPEVNPDMVASHLYTSGTTGEPKGAELTHRNYAANINACKRRLHADDSDLAMSVLPLWHVLERLAEYVFLFWGASIYYSSIPSLKKDLKVIRPTCLVVVPRILEKIYDTRVVRSLEKKSGITKGIFKFFIGLSIDSRRGGWNPFRAIEKIPRQYLDKQVFSKLKEGLGGRIRLLVSGGGKLRRDIDDFFFAAGIPILEGYGLTETSPVIAVRSFEDFTPGTVGKPLGNLEVKILDHDTGNEMKKTKIGVIFVKGPSVMKGYYKNDYETRKAFRNGWFDTGDLGYIDKQGNIVITGRMKNIIVLSNGENISPEYIEFALKRSPLITNAIVVGQDWKGLGALIEPDFEYLEDIYGDEYANLESSEIHKLYKREIRHSVSPLSGFREFECIKSFRLLKKSLEPGKELTWTMKLRRSVVERTFNKEIENIGVDINGKR